MPIDTDLSKPFLALMMHDVYRYMVQTKAGSEVAGDPRSLDVGEAVVRRGDGGEKW